MKELFKKWLEKLACRHEWTIIAKTSYTDCNRYLLVCAQVIDWVRFPTAAHPEPCNSNPIRCLERNNQPNRLR